MLSDLESDSKLHLGGFSFGTEHHLQWQIKHSTLVYNVKNCISVIRIQHIDDN